MLAISKPLYLREEAENLQRKAQVAEMPVHPRTLDVEGSRAGTGTVECTIDHSAQESSSQSQSWDYMQTFWFIRLPGLYDMLYPAGNFLLAVHLYFHSHLLGTYLVMSRQMASKIQSHCEQEFLVQSIYMHRYQAVEISVKALYLQCLCVGHPLAAQSDWQG